LTHYFFSVPKSKMETTPGVSRRVAAACDVDSNVDDVEMQVIDQKLG
jgi:hypothetical protein